MSRIERNLQSEIVSYLKSRGAYVVKNSANPGVPSGTPDISAFHNNKWTMIEVKSSSSAKRQPLQDVQLARLKSMNPNLVFVVYPGNWERVKSLLDNHFFNLE